MNLTKQNIADIPVPSADKRGRGEAVRYDDDIPGFGIRVHAGGSRQWFFWYRIGTKQRRISFGKYPPMEPKQAREIAVKLYAQVKLGQDPAAEKAEAHSKIVETFGAILTTYLIRKKSELKARTYEEVQRHLLQHCKPLHSADITKIERRTIAHLLATLATNSGPHLANSVRSSLSAYFVWAMKEGIASANPVIATNKAIVAGSRDRVLDDAELAAIWAALGDDAYSDILRLLALTAARRDEIGGLVWSEVNLDKCLISLPAERTKNSRPFDIPLSEPAVAILRARPHLSEFVFTNGGSFGGWSNHKIVLDRRIGSIAPWRLHDLRRTVSTRMHDEIGILPHIVEACLNHISGHQGGVAGVYNKSVYAKDKAIALARWAEHLLAIVEGRQSKIVPIKAS